MVVKEPEPYFSMRENSKQRRRVEVAFPRVEVAVGRGRKADVSDDWLREDDIETLLRSPAITLRDRTVYACAIGLGLRLNDDAARHALQQVRRLRWDVLSATEETRSR